MTQHCGLIFAVNLYMLQEIFFKWELNKRLFNRMVYIKNSGGIKHDWLEKKLPPHNQLLDDTNVPLWNWYLPWQWTHCFQQLPTNPPLLYASWTDSVSIIWCVVCLSMSLSGLDLHFLYSGNINPLKFSEFLSHCFWLLSTYSFSFWASCYWTDITSRWWRVTSASLRISSWWWICYETRVPTSSLRPSMSSR